MLVKLTLLFLGGSANPAFDLAVSHDHETPRLKVGARGCRPRDRDCLIDQGVRDRVARLLPDRAARPHAIVEGPQPRGLLRRGQAFEREGNGAIRGIGHGAQR